MISTITFDLKFDVIQQLWVFQVSIKARPWFDRFQSIIQTKLSHDSTELDIINNTGFQMKHIAKLEKAHELLWIVLTCLLKLLKIKLKFFYSPNQKMKYEMKIRLFIIYVNDLPFELSTMCKLYAEEQP